MDPLATFGNVGKQNWMRLPLDGRGEGALLGCLNCSLGGFGGWRWGIAAGEWLKVDCQIARGSVVDDSCS